MARKNKLIAAREASTKVKELFAKAEEAFGKNKSLANRYVKNARKAAMKVRMRLPAVLNRKFFKHCYSFLMPGKNSRVRVNRGKVIIYCMDCKKFTRIPLNIKKIIHNNQSMYGYLKKKMTMKQILGGLRDKEDRF